MAVVDIATLKSYFETGDTPTQAQFVDLIDTLFDPRLTGALLSANDLSDLADISTALTNLGLNNVDNTSDASKPISTAQATVNTALQNAIAAITATSLGLGNVNNTSDANKPVSTAQATADALVLSTANAYSDSLVVGLWDDRGNYNASVNTFPATGGSGSASAILKGDIWTVSVAGTLGGHVVNVGDTVRALVNTPGQTDSNWAIAENNIGYTPENTSNKDASGGYAGLTLFKINFKNVLNTFTSFFTNSNTAARTYTFPDKDGTVAMTSDITGGSFTALTGAYSDNTSLNNKIVAMDAKINANYNQLNLVTTLKTLTGN